MDTIDKIRKQSGKVNPYPRAIRAEVFKLKEQADAEVECSLADHTGAIKVIVYDGMFAKAKVQVGDVVLMRNYQKASGNILFVNKTTTVNKCPNLHQPVPPNSVAIAKELVDPCVPDVVPIGFILEEKEEGAVSVQGVITTDEVAKKVGKSESQMVRNIHVEDGSGSIQVALWNQASKSPVKSGDRVRISHVSAKHNAFLKGMALTSNRNTTIKIMEEEPEEKKVVVLTVHCQMEDSVEVLCEIDDSIDTISVSNEIAMKLWNSTKSEEIMLALEGKQIVHRFIVLRRVVVRVIDQDEDLSSTSDSD